MLTAVESGLVEHFGHDPQRASVSFVGVETIEVLRFEPIPDERAYVSLGMSRHPMTAGDAARVATDGPRAELMLHVRDPLDSFADVWRNLAVLAAAPSVEGVVYRSGMTLELGTPLVSGSACSGVLVVESALAAVGTADGPVAILQVVPATPVELAWCRVRGAPALRERWREQRTDLLDAVRRSVSLD